MPEALLDKVKAVAAEAGALALARSTQGYKRWEKAGGEPVCEVDLAVDVLLRERLHAIDPDAAWLSEESVDDKTRLAAERGLPAALERDLRTLAKEMRALAPRDKHRYLVANADFHVKIVEATGHARLQSFVPLVRMSSEVVYMRMQDQGRRLSVSASEHARILDAIRSGDGVAAERLAREHVRNATAHWLRGEDTDGCPSFESTISSSTTS